MTRSHTTSLLLAAAVLIALASAASAQPYHPYVNDRFGTTADVPAGWHPDPPPDNNDGRVFRSRDGLASVTVYGGLHVRDTIDEAMQTFEQPQSGETITYRRREPRALVVSGTRGDIIFYARHVLSCRDQIWNSVQIEYPASRKAAYDATVTHIARSLRSGPSWQVPHCK